MKETPNFQVDIGEVDQSNRNEVILDRLLRNRITGKARPTDPMSTVNELIERYLQAVRRRNGLRRNRQRVLSLECDMAVLYLVSKKELSQSLGKRLQDALTVTNDGKKVIPETSIEKLRQQILDDFYNPGRKKTTYTALESIVRRICKNNPDATSTDVINEMKARPSEYGIIEIDDEYVTIEVIPSGGTGKDTQTLSRSLSTVRNIMTRIKRSRK